MLKESRLNNLIISKSDYEQLIRWSLCTKEIGGVIFGRKNRVKHVVRLANELDSKNYFSWDNRERLSQIRKYKELGYSLVAEFHSHPAYHHPRVPSKNDVEYFKKGIPHLICFPCEREIKCWEIKRSLAATRKAALTIKILREDQNE